MKRVFQKYQTDYPKYSSIRNDCQIVSISASLNLPYLDVYRKMYQAGWRSLHGNVKMNWRFAMMKVIRAFGFEPCVVRVERVPKGKKALTVGELAALNPRKRLIARCAGHVVGIRNGIVYDGCPEDVNRRVYWAWQLLPPAAAARYKPLVIYYDTSNKEN